MGTLGMGLLLTGPQAHSIWRGLSPILTISTIVSLPFARFVFQRFFRYVQMLVQKKETIISGAQKPQEHHMTNGTTIARQGDKTTHMGYELKIFGLISV